MFGRFLPRETSFFDFFEQHAGADDRRDQGVPVDGHDRREHPGEVPAHLGHRARDRHDHAPLRRGAAQDVHHADRSRLDPPPDHADGRHHGLRRGGRRAHRALRADDDDRRRARPRRRAPSRGAAGRAARSAGCARSRSRRPRSSSASTSTGSRTRPTRSFAARSRGCSRKRRIRSSSSSGKRSTRTSRARPTAVRTSRTSSRA